MVSFTRWATIITVNRTKKLPILAAIERVISPKNDKEVYPAKIEVPIKRIAAPKLAPELIPSTNGPAKGFLNSVCIKSPLKASPAPTNMEVKAFGTR